MYYRHLAAYEFVAATLRGGTVALDLGCGSGYGTRLLADRGANAIGVDVDPAAIRHARGTYGGDGIGYETYDGSTLPFPSATFDLVTSFQVIEHVHDDDRFVAEARRVLRPGGRLIITTPNRALRLREGQAPWNRFHVREYSIDQLSAVLRGYFQSVEVKGVTAAPAVMSFERERIAWVQRTVGRDPLNLRRFIPERLKPTVVRLLRSSAQTAGSTTATVPALSAAEYWATGASPEDWLDLLALCE